MLSVPTGKLDELLTNYDNVGVDELKSRIPVWAGYMPDGYANRRINFLGWLDAVRSSKPRRHGADWLLNKIHSQPPTRQSVSALPGILVSILHEETASTEVRINRCDIAGFCIQDS